MLACLVVSSDHNYANTSLLADLEGGTDLLARGIQHSNQTNKIEVCLFMMLRKGISLGNTARNRWEMHLVLREILGVLEIHLFLGHRRVVGGQG